MQLYAADEHSKPIFAFHALKQQNYYCLECHGIVRVRGGMHRQPHFYHHHSSPHCRQSGKSMIHLQIQCFLLRLFSEQDCQLEKRFPEISRIADVVWESQKLIFEIQCSPIAAQEVEQRNRDYRSMGYDVVWILHDGCFNKWRVSAAEVYLQHLPHYYTNLTAEGKGYIYDQFEVIKGGIRHLKLGHLPIKPSHPITKSRLMLAKDVSLPALLEKKVKNCPIFFAGDLMHTWDNQKNFPYIEKILEWEKATIPQTNSNLFHRLKFWFLHYVLRPYLIVFQMLAEKTCKS